MSSGDSASTRVDFAGIQALSSRAAGYSVAEKCLQVQAEAEARDPSLVSAAGVKLHADAWSWYVGALGEIEVGAMLAKLGPQWFVRHAVPIGAGTKDVDHLVIGPGGVFAINTKHHAGASVWVGDHIVKVNGVNQRHVTQARSDGRDVGRRLSARAELPVPVTAAVAILGARSIKDDRAVGARQVEVLDAERLVSWLESRPQQLRAAELELIKLAAEEPQAWHVDPRAADTLRVMHRFERLRARVGPMPTRDSRPSAAPEAMPKPTPRRSRSKARIQRSMPAVSNTTSPSFLALLKMWLGLGAPVLLALFFREVANQPCTSPISCVLPAVYLSLRPFILLACLALLGAGAVGSAIWLVRRLAGR